MAVDFFGAGVLFATPLSDASGNTIALPSPVQFGIVQDVTIDDSAEVKELYGANQYPVDIGRGKAKLMLKVKQAQFSALLFNSVYYGQAITAVYDAVLADAVGTAVPTGVGATAVNVVATAPYGGTSLFIADLGVQDGNGVPFTRVATGPTGGQYSLVTGAGSTGATYQFSNQDVGKLVFINYQYSQASVPSSAKLITVTNTPMGSVPVFSAQFFAKRVGPDGTLHTFWRKFPACVATKLSLDWKNDDFVIPDMEISCFADANNNVQYIGSSV